MKTKMCIFEYRYVTGGEKNDIFLKQVLDGTNQSLTFNLVERVNIQQYVWCIQWVITT